MCCELSRDIDDLIDQARSRGVEIDISLDDDSESDARCIWLASLVRTTGVSGEAARLIENLISISSDHDAIVMGAIEPPNHKLEEYYSYHGFEIERQGERTLIAYTP